MVRHGNLLGVGAAAIKLCITLRDPRIEPRIRNDSFGRFLPAVEQKHRDDWIREINSIVACQGNQNIVHLHAIVCEQGEEWPEYVVLELGQGSLEGALYGGFQGAPCAATLDQKLFALLSVARGLTHMHTLGLTHRDLKPANVIWMAAPQPDLWSCQRMKLVDLGLSKANRMAGTDTHGAGTADYCAPEVQVEGMDQTVAVDLFSFGVMVIELLCGQHPAVAGQMRMEGGRRTVVPEVERRRGQIDLVSDDGRAGEAKRFAVRCLEDDPLLRPTAADAVRLLESLSDVAAVVAAAVAAAREEAAAEAVAAERAAAAAAQRQAVAVAVAAARSDSDAALAAAVGGAETANAERDAAVAERDACRQQLEELRGGGGGGGGGGGSGPSPSPSLTSQRPLSARGAGGGRSHRGAGCPFPALFKEGATTQELVAAGRAIADMAVMAANANDPKHGLVPMI
jgi:hypothetical protein